MNIIFVIVIVIYSTYAMADVGSVMSHFGVGFRC